MDAAAVVDVPAHAVATVFAGELEIVVHDLHIMVQLSEVFHLVLCQWAVPVGEQAVLELHHRLHFQAPAGAVVDVVVVVLGGIPQQRQVIAPAQHEVQRLHGAAFPDVDAELVGPGGFFQEIHRRIGGVGGMGDHHPQLGAALPGVVGIFGQAVYLFQHPRGLLDEPPPLLGGDHAGGRALKDAQAVFPFQILQRFADVGLGGVELLCRSAHRAPFLNGNEITQFCDVQSSSLLVNADSPLFYQPGGRRVKPRLTPRRAGLIIKKNAPLKSRAGGGNMERYRVVRLEEQMYGCEELARRGRGLL